MAQSFNPSEFATLKNLADSGNVVGYYQFLASKGYAYGNLALGVVTNDTLSGITAREYAQAVARDMGVSLSDSDWADISQQLMRADFDAREQIYDRDSSASLELGYEPIQQYHNVVFAGKGLPAMAWTAEAILSLSDDPAAAWDNLLATSSGFIFDNYNTFLLDIAGLANQEYTQHAGQLFFAPGIANPDTLGSPAWMLDNMPASYQLMTLNNPALIQGVIDEWMVNGTAEFFSEAWGNVQLTSALIEVIRDKGLSWVMEDIGEWGAFELIDEMLQHGGAELVQAFNSLGWNRVVDALQEWKHSAFIQQVQELVEVVPGSIGEQVSGWAGGIIDTGTMVLANITSWALTLWLEANTSEHMLAGFMGLNGLLAIEVGVGVSDYFIAVDSLVYIGDQCYTIQERVSNSDLANLVSNGDGTYRIEAPWVQEEANDPGESGDAPPLPTDGSVIQLDPITITGGETIIEHAGNFYFAVEDPLVLDLDGNGIETLAIDGNSPGFELLGEQGVVADHGWVAPTDALLAIDRNGNGMIDDISELFGKRGLSGFAELAAHDSNGDGMIDHQDEVFAELLVWQDVNSDRISQADELFTLAQLGISSISLEHSVTPSLDNGNLISAVGSFTFTDGRVHQMADVNFAVDLSTLRGNGRADLFDFSDEQGRFSLAGFEDGLDMIRLNGGNYQNLAFIEEHNGTLVRVSDELEIKLVGIREADLSADDFMFV